MNDTHTILAVMAGLGWGIGILALIIAYLALRTARTAGAAVRVLAGRRKRDQGPPEDTPERRHRSPDEARARRRDEDDPQWRIDEPQEKGGPPTYPPRPAAHPDPVPGAHRAPDEPATVESAPPTADMRTLPPPGSIRNGR